MRKNIYIAVTLLLIDLDGVDTMTQATRQFVRGYELQEDSDSIRQKSCIQKLFSILQLHFLIKLDHKDTAS